MTIKMTRVEYLNKLKDKEEHDTNLILISLLSFATCDSCEECIYYQNENWFRKPWEETLKTGIEYNCTLKELDDAYGKVFCAVKKQLALL